MKALNLLLAATVAAFAVGPCWADAAKFPERDHQLHLIVPFAAGGGVDNAARLLGEQLRKQLGVMVIVENRAGASGTLGGKAVQGSPADGYTLLFSAATHVLAKRVLANAPYDPQLDFTPVARVGEAPLMLVISPQSKAQKLGEVLAAAKQKRESWMAAIPASGAPSHLATLLLAKQGGVTFTYVPYKGTQPALTDVAGDHVNLLMDSMISLMQMARAGKVRPIAITSKKRSALLPEVPTVQESGIADFSYVS
jgi:tripartite-type tricarboxylate transporter receptor subunit TctC